MGVASFENEAATCDAIDATVRGHYSINEVPDVQSVKDYLARPRMIATGDVTPAPGILYYKSIHTTSDLRSLMSDLNLYRLRGCTGLRCSIKFTLVVSTTPFHQGILALSFQYGVNDVVAPNEIRALNMPLMVHLPHVRLDMAENTMVTLDVPYICHREYFYIDDTIGTEPMYLGVVAVNKLTNPAVVAGQTPATYSLYMSLHDIELIGASPYTTQTAVLQSGMVSSQVMKEAKDKQVVSKTLSAAANVARTIASIPSLSVVGGTADWFLRSSAKVAEAFGFSKPLDETKVARMARFDYAGDAQVDLPNVGYVAGPFQSNKLAVNSNLGCTDDDQMSFDYVLTKYSYIYRGQMAETSNEGSLLYATKVCPTNFWYRDNQLSIVGSTGNVALPTTAPTGFNAFLPSTLCYVGSNFRYWRGNLKFRVTFAKTKLHGGRVQFTFVPFLENPPPNDPLSNTVLIPEAPVVSGNGLSQPTGYVKVFDLRDGSSFEFEVPFVSTEPYVSTYGSIGSVSMMVVNSLRSPGNTASTIDFMVEVAAEPGFEFAVVAPSMLDGIAPSGTPTITFQSGVSIAKKTNDASQNVIGERFHSLKQLAMIPDWIVGDVNNAQIITSTLTPWFKTNEPPVALPMPDDTNLWYASKSGRVARMFAFVNGSTNYVCYRDGGASQNMTMSVKQEGNDDGEANLIFGDIRNRSSNNYSSPYIPETQTCIRTVVPTYSRFTRLPRSVLTTPLGGRQTGLAPGGVGTVTYTSEFLNARTDLIVRNSSGSTRRIALGRAAGEDARASQFIGPPVCALFAATNTKSPVAGNFGTFGF